jgi:hypothetical protein
MYVLLPMVYSRCAPRYPGGVSRFHVRKTGRAIPHRQENEFQLKWTARRTSRNACGMEAIYERPRDYDLEHEGDEEDVAFHLRLLARWRTA